MIERNDSGNDQPREQPREQAMVPMPARPPGPRERLLDHGAQTLTDAELLALLLRTGLPGLPALQFAEYLVASAGGLGALIRRDPHELMGIRGLGPGKAAELAAVREIARRLTSGPLPRQAALSGPGDCARYLQGRLGDLEHEVFGCVFLDNRHRVLRFEVLFRGTVDGASVHPREVVKRALALNAAALILAHNHPSGVCEPSTADRQITERLRDALALVDIRVLDHFIIGTDPPLSFAEQGLL